MVVTHDKATDRYRITINETIDGKRIRKTKQLPRGMTLEQAYDLAESMLSGQLPFQDRLARMAAGRPDNLGTVYFIKSPSLPGLVKIGMTRGTVYERIRNLSTAHAASWQIICHGVMKHPDLVELALHQQFSDVREAHNREFFRISDDAALEALAVCHEVDGVDLQEAINSIGRK